MSVVVSINLGNGFGPAHHQGMRPTCLAFVVSELNRHENQVGEPLSAEYLYRCAARRMPGWRPEGGLEIQSALSAAQVPGQPTAGAYPYAQTEPSENPPLLLPIPSTPAGFDAMHASTFQSISMTAMDVHNLILGGNMLGLVIAITDTLLVPTAGVVAHSFSVMGTMLHAVVAMGVGVDTATGEPHVLIRNTWGPNWGVAGNAWLPLSYLDSHLFQAFKV